MPAFAAVQAWAAVDRRARVVAAVNVLNAAYMLAGGAVVAVLQSAGVALSTLFCDGGHCEPSPTCRSCCGRGIVMYARIWPAPLAGLRLRAEAMRPIQIARTCGASGDASG